MSSDGFTYFKLPCSDNPFNHGMEEVIDVRTPLEYNEDHIPGAINLPVLTNSERHLVGKEYSYNSFKARRAGAALISSNISKIINTHFKDKPKSYSCLVYCWRGGQRSKSLAMVLSLIGFNIKCLNGGYKNYRKYVQEELPKVSAQFSYKVIGGMTGSGKTLLLKQLENVGEQVLDFEELANHRGSVLGINHDRIPEQPSTKLFESRILEKLLTFDPAQPVWVEAEGKRIGSVQIPHGIFELIKARVTYKYELICDISLRIQYLLAEYNFFVENPEELKESLQKLKKFNPPLKRWFKLIDEMEKEKFLLDILENHYDPLYEKSKSKSFFNGDCTIQVVEIGDISEQYFRSTVLPIISLNGSKESYLQQTHELEKSTAEI